MEVWDVGERYWETKYEYMERGRKGRVLGWRGHERKNKFKKMCQTRNEQAQRRISMVEEKEESSLFVKENCVILYIHICIVHL